MRVITGSAKGHKLKTPKGLRVRPTSDRIKESIFNIIGDIKDDDIVLDLFSGTGSMGIEFLSRGAKKCFFIDNHIDSIKIIKENLINTKLIDKASIYKNNSKNAIAILGRKNVKFKYIFLDPPYNEELIMPVLKEIDRHALLKENSGVIVEHESKLSLPDFVGNIYKIDSRRYGDTRVSFFKLKC